MTMTRTSPTEKMFPEARSLRSRARRLHLQPVRRRCGRRRSRRRDRDRRPRRRWSRSRPPSRAWRPARARRTRDGRRDVAAHADAVRADSGVKAARIGGGQGCQRQAIGGTRLGVFQVVTHVGRRDDQRRPIGGGDGARDGRAQRFTLRQAEPAQHDRRQAQPRLARRDQRQQDLDRVLVLVCLAIGAQRGRLGAQRRDERSWIGISSPGSCQLDAPVSAPLSADQILAPGTAAGVIGREHEHALGHDDAGEQLSGQGTGVTPARVRRHDGDRGAARSTPCDQRRRLGRHRRGGARIEGPATAGCLCTRAYPFFSSGRTTCGFVAGSLSRVSLTGIRSAIVTPAMRLRRPSSSSPTSLTNAGAVAPWAISMSLDRKPPAPRPGRCSPPGARGCSR